MGGRTRLVTRLDLHNGHSVWQRMVLALCSAAAACFFVYFPLTNSDIWWHLAAGREMIAKGSFLSTDPFAFTLQNPQWIDLHWLFQLMTYVVFSMGGVTGLLAFKMVMVALLAIVITLILPSRSYALLSGVVLSLLLYEARYLVLVRPILVTVVAMGIFLLCFERYLRTGNLLWLLWLVPLQVVWTNSQGLFILGPVIAGAYLVGQVLELLLPHREERRETAQSLMLPLLVVSAALVAACLLNPYGIRGALFPFKLFTRIDPSLGNLYSRNISENIPLYALAGPDKRYLWVTLVATAVGVFGLVLNNRSARYAHILLLAAFLGLAVLAKRNVLLYFVVLSPIIGYNLSAPFAVSWRATLHPGEMTEKRIAVRTVAIMLALLIGINGVAQARMIERYPSDSSLSPFRYPVAAVDYLQEHPVPGHIFNSIRYGGYLIWRLYPKQQVFIDGRLIIRSAPFFAEYLAVLEKPELFTPVAEKFGITQVVLPTAVFYQYMGLVKWLYHSPDWALVFTDGASVVFTRADLAPTGPIDLGSSLTGDSLVTVVRDNWQEDRQIGREAVSYLSNLFSQMGYGDVAQQVNRSAVFVPKGEP